MRKPCAPGKHDWRWFDGRPAICRKCGDIGHPLGAKTLMRYCLDKAARNLEEQIRRSKP